MKEISVPRIMIAGTNSSAGKTTLVCALLQAFINRAVSVGAFKCGPDYIDPMFHKKILQADSSNLDPFFFDENTCRRLLAENGGAHRINLIEGVMGFYDGIGMSGEASSYALAEITNTPVVLVIDAKGASLSLLAELAGFLTFLPNNHICGVIFNRCSEMVYQLLKAEAEKRFPAVRMLGFLPYLPECKLESRHLGLITAQEVQDLQKKMRLLAESAEAHIDLDALLQLADMAKYVRYEENPLPRAAETVKIAVAQDEAFCFYYDENLRILQKLGAELVPFSPLRDPTLPEKIHGLYLGGGYPELYAETLSQNETMRNSVLKAIKQKLPCIAECGGFQYLTQSIGAFAMVGALPGKTFNAGKLTRFGYVSLQAKHDNLLCRAGDTVPAHEFHYWDSEQTGSAFTAQKPSGRTWDCVFASDTLYAGYPHFHFASDERLAQNFIRACLKEKHRND